VKSARNAFRKTCASWHPRTASTRSEITLSLGCAPCQIAPGPAACCWDMHRVLVRWACQIKPMAMDFCVCGDHIFSKSLGVCQHSAKGPQNFGTSRAPASSVHVQASWFEANGMSCRCTAGALRIWLEGEHGRRGRAGARQAHRHQHLDFQGRCRALPRARAVPATGAARRGQERSLARGEAAEAGGGRGAGGALGRGGRGARAQHPRAARAPRLVQVARVQDDQRGHCGSAGAGEPRDFG
jgi:hypothetical protein